MNMNYQLITHTLMIHSLHLIQAFGTTTKKISIKHTVMPRPYAWHTLKIQVGNILNTSTTFCFTILLDQNTQQLKSAKFHPTTTAVVAHAVTVQHCHSISHSYTIHCTMDLRRESFVTQLSNKKNPNKQ